MTDCVASRPVTGSLLGPPPGGAGTGLAPPAKALKRGRNAPLVCGAKARGVEADGVFCDLTDGDPGLLAKVPGNGLFPSVGFIPGSLLGHDMIALEIPGRPPLCAVAVASNRFGE